MIEKILDLSIQNRWFVVILTVVACALGLWSLSKLPIDAVPDITNNQVQINAIAPALTPVEMEKQITFQIENILAGTPTLEYTRSFSRNGFASRASPSTASGSPETRADGIRVKRFLAGMLTMLLLVVASFVVLFGVLREPGTSTPREVPLGPGVRPSAPPTDLAPDETWLGDVDLSASLSLIHISEPTRPY